MSLPLSHFPVPKCLSCSSGFCHKVEPTYLHYQTSVQWLSPVWLFVTPWTAACQASLSITNSWSLLKLMSIESVMPSNRLILCHPFLLLPSIFPSIRVFSNESVFCIRWPKYWSFCFSISPSNEYSGLLSLGLTGLISSQSKWLSRVFSNTTVQNYGAYYGAPHYGAYSNNVKMLQYEDLAQPNK